MLSCFGIVQDLSAVLHAGTIEAAMEKVLRLAPPYTSAGLI